MDAEAPEQQALRERGPVSGHTCLPSSAGFTAQEQPRRAAELLQGHPLGDRARHPGPWLRAPPLPQVPRTHMGSPVYRVSSAGAPPEGQGQACRVPGRGLQESPGEGRAHSHHQPHGDLLPLPPLRLAACCSPSQLFSKVCGAIFWKHRVHVIFL